MGNISIREYLKKFTRGEFDSRDTKTQIDAGWYDWFCNDFSLRNKTYALTKKLLQIVDSEKIDQDKNYVFFKNNCPMDGSLYDDFRICDLETGDVIYTIVPRCGHRSSNGRAELWGRDNDFNGAIIEGTWSDIKRYFKNV